MPNAKKKGSGSKISNTEWGMVISALFIIDGIQFSLDWVGIPWIATVGMIANRFISFVTSLAWPTYLYLRGVSLSAPRAMSIIVAFFFEEIPDVDALPFWGLDGIVMCASVKAEEKIKEKTGIDVEKVAGMAQDKTSDVDNTTTNPTEGGENSDEYADAMGQENESRNESEPEDTGVADENKEGDEKHETSDEEADELGKESDKKSEEGKSKDAKDKEKEKGKGGGGQPKTRGGGLDFGGGQRGARGQNSAEAGQDPLNLRGSKADTERILEKEKRSALDNLLDLGGMGKDDETSHSE